MAERSWLLLNLAATVVLGAVILGVSFAPYEWGSVPCGEAARKHQLRVLHDMVHLYFRDEGEWPAGLASLVPDYVQAVKPPCDDPPDRYSYTSPQGLPADAVFIQEVQPVDAGRQFGVTRGGEVRVVE